METTQKLEAPLKNPREQTREENKAELLWNRGGDGWGICAVGNMFAAICGPQREIRSPIVIGIDRSNPDAVSAFTDGDLAELVELSREVAERHRKLLGMILESDNLTTIRKWSDVDWSWAKRTWESGARHCQTLEQVRAEILERY